MHTGSLKKWALALTFWVALHTSALRAQIFTAPLQASTTGTNPVDFEYRADGTLIAKGNFGVGSLLSGDQGDGTRMLWFPSLGAFRAGTVASGLGSGSGAWYGDIGAYSAALGINNTASGYASTGLGNSTSAYGDNTLSFGFLCLAQGGSSLAGGTFSWANGGNSVALNYQTSATGNDSVALGTFSLASGDDSFAMGFIGTASGHASTVSGYYNTAAGDFTSASGYRTTASAYNSFVLGSFNVGGGNSTAWIATDPLFEIGNGGASNGRGNPNATGPSDALVVYKNGDAEFQGVVKVSPGGDIPMYTGN